MLYEVRCYSSDQRLLIQQIEAVDQQQVIQQLTQSKLIPLEIKVMRRGAGKVFARRAFDPVLFSQELLALLNAGLTIVEAIDALAEKEQGGDRKTILVEILAQLRDGRPFSAALERLTGIFSPLYLGIVRSSEGTSDLPKALGRFLDYQKRIDVLRAQIIGASIYPCILFLVGVSVSLFLMGYVVPRFASVYESAGSSLPFASRILLALGLWIHEHQGPVVLGVVGTITVIVAAGRYAIRSGALLMALSRIGWIGDRIRQIELSRLFMTLGMLLDGGIPVRKALPMVWSSISPSSRPRLVLVEKDIQEGTSLSDALSKVGLVTPISLRLIRVGERSGQMGDMLRQAAAFHEEETGRWISRFTKLFEPLLMVVIGGLVGGVVILLYMPIFDLAGSVQ